MTKQTLTILAFVTLGTVLGGCNGDKSAKTASTAPKPMEKVAPATIVAGQEADLFPAKAGNSWVYAATTTQSSPQGSKNSSVEVTFKVAEVTDTPDGKEILINVTADGNPSDVLRWRISPTGLYQISGTTKDPKSGQLKEVKFEPPLMVIPFPPKAGSEQSFELTGVRTGAVPGPFKATISVDNTQEVDTDNGRVSALPTVQESTYTANDIQVRSTSTSYWAPKLGIARYYQEVVAVNKQGQTIQNTTVLRLKSHNP